MESVRLKSRAKINLALSVRDKRDDGYHNILSIMEAIELADEIYIENIDDGIKIECDNEDIPIDNRNLAYIAAKKIKDITGINKGVSIKIKKNIPVGAGLAGGSANAAAVLRGLNKLWALEFADDKLAEIGMEIGSDVPFCTISKTCLVSGKGEKLEILPSLPSIWILLIKPKDISISSKWAYNELDKIGIYNKVDIKEIKKAIYARDIELIGKRLFNDFEYPVGLKYPIIKRIKQLLLKNNALGSAMSGSGPTVFGIFRDKKQGQKAISAIRQEIDGYFYLCRNYNRGGDIFWTRN